METGEFTAYNGWPADDRNRNLARQQSGCRRRTTRNKKQFNIKAMFFEYAGLLCDPYRGERTRLGAVADVQSFEFRLRAAPRSDRKEANGDSKPYDSKTR